MSVQTINAEIIAGNFTNDELVSIIEAVKYARAQLGKRSIRKLSVGDNVSFTSNKTNRTVVGTVEKIAIKYVTVREASPSRFTSGLWKVPASMLTAV